MAKDVGLPEIGEGVKEGELVKWLVKPKDTVKIDQGLCEVLTDKATVEIPSTIDGIIKTLKAKEGDTIQVGQTLLVIEETANLSDSKKITSNKAASTTKNISSKITDEPKATIINASPFEISPPVAGANVLATPATRKLARELGVDINNIKGSGNQGRVTQQDVRSATASQPIGTTFKTEQDQVVPLRGIRKKIAQAMVNSKNIIPHFSVLDEADVTNLVKLRVKLKQDYPDSKITFLPFVMKALVLSIKEFSMVNASLTEDEIIYKKTCNIGFATDTPNGLVVPVIKNVNQKTILEMSKELVTLSDRARNNKLTLEDMQNATITITNIGSISGISATPIINHPEVCIVGMYKIRKTPVFKGSSFVPRDVMNISITADHRLIDGAVAARFLGKLIDKLENPIKMVVE